MLLVFDSEKPVKRTCTFLPGDKLTFRIRGDEFMTLPVTNNWIPLDTVFCSTLFIFFSILIDANFI